MCDPQPLLRSSPACMTLPGRSPRAASSHTSTTVPSLSQVSSSFGSRTTLSKASTQKRTVMKDRYGKHVHLEELEDTPEALPRDDLQHDLQQLLRHFCREGWAQEAK